MHSNVTIKNVSWPHFIWTTLYIFTIETRLLMCTYQHKATYFPAIASITVVWILIANPLIYFAEGHAFLWRAVDSKCDEICVTIRRFAVAARSATVVAFTVHIITVTTTVLTACITAVTG